MHPLLISSRGDCTDKHSRRFPTSSRFACLVSNMRGRSMFCVQHEPKPSTLLVLLALTPPEGRAEHMIGVIQLVTKTSLRGSSMEFIHYSWIYGRSPLTKTHNAREREAPLGPCPATSRASARPDFSGGVYKRYRRGDLAPSSPSSTTTTTVIEWCQPFSTTCTTSRDCSSLQCPLHLTMCPTSLVPSSTTIMLRSTDSRRTPNALRKTAAVPHTSYSPASSPSLSCCRVCLPV